MRPFVAEHLDGLRLTKIAVELDHEPLIPPKALAQDRFGQPGRPNDNREGWRAFSPKARQNHLKFSPARAADKTATVGGKHPNAFAASPRKRPAMAAEDRRECARAGNHQCSVAPAEYVRQPLILGAPLPVDGATKLETRKTVWSRQLPCMLRILKLQAGPFFQRVGHT